MEDTVFVLGILNGDLLERSQNDDFYNGFLETDSKKK